EPAVERRDSGGPFFRIRQGGLAREDSRPTDAENLEYRDARVPKLESEPLGCLEGAPRSRRTDHCRAGSKQTSVPFLECPDSPDRRRAAVGPEFGPASSGPHRICLLPAKSSQASAWRPTFLDARDRSFGAQR